MRPKRSKSLLPDRRSITHIGYSGGSNDALKHLTTLFEHHQIELIVEGSSFGHDIAVFDADVERAVELLRDDPEALRYKITVYES